MKKIVLLMLFVASSIIGQAQDEYTLADSSKLTISGTSTVSDWDVVANSVAANLKYDGVAPKQINLEVEVADIMSERGASMDKKMHDALKKEQHPKVTFKLTEVKNKSTLVGSLAIAGVEKTVEIPVKMESNSEGLKISGKKKIVLKNYNIEPPSAMFGQIIVGDDVTVNFDLVFSKN